MAGKGAGGAGSKGSSGRAVRTPGPRRQSPEVYRRRRIAVVVLMALILGVLGVGVSAAVVAVGSNAAGEAATTAAAGLETTPSGAASTPSAAPTGSASATPTATPTPSCDPHLITVAASTDKAVYGPSEKPLFTLKVTNGNPVPCEVNVGTKQMEFLVVSGVDRIFSSKDCQATAEDLPKTIAAGASETANFPWSRVRSIEGCKAASVQPKPGIYVLTASLGSTTSSKAVFELK
ncbi:hypothetical protein [Sinomonas atrocyanea]|uniref:hypothetical protein n=1 Tax=Sinomonas atrocyanea TaxID=37927 RepID=UPI003D96D4F7